MGMHESKHAMEIDAMPWPLIPLSTYRAPWRSRTSAETSDAAIESAGVGVSDSDGVDVGDGVLEMPALPVLLGSSSKANRKGAMIAIKKRKTLMRLHTNETVEPVRRCQGCVFWGWTR